MLYITRTTPKGCLRGEEFVWRIGRPLPLYFGYKMTDIAEVKATDEELKYVLDRFRNIPYYRAETTAKEMTWRRDVAQFIYEHLI
jgi:hypothetical protein